MKKITKAMTGVCMVLLCLFLSIPWKLEAQVNSGGTAQTSDHSKQIVGYITNWDAWKNSNAGVPGAGALTHLNIDYSKYTILNFSFFGVAVDGSLHSGDLRNKNIYQTGVVQEPGDILFTDIYSSWDMHILFGEIDPLQYINEEAKTRAEAQGFAVEVGASTWSHPGWGLSGSLPLPLHKEDGAPGLIELAHQNGVKVMASIGGWSMCKHFPEMAADPVKRQKFVDDCLKLMNMGFDGIDLDWEYPGPYAGMNFTGTNADFENFKVLVQEIRNAIGPTKLITAAFSADPVKLQGFDWPALVSTMDYFNMMTYDFNGGFSNIAGHNAPIYPYTGAEAPTFNWQSTFNALTSLGVPASKLNFGIPFYGRGVVSDGPAALNAPLLKRAETVQPDGPIQTAADFTNWPRDVYDGTPNHFFIEQQTGAGSGWTRMWDHEAKVPYMVKDNFFLSYDDEESIGLKAQYIVDNQLAGTIVWTVYGDLDISGTATSFGTKLKRWSSVNSPLVNKVNEVFASTGTPGNQSPTVSLTSPVDGTVFTDGDNVSLSATASDSDGTVTKVEFYNGAVKLGEDTTSPYEYLWSNVSAGSYTLSARAIDNDNASTNSNAVSITVNSATDTCQSSGFKVVGYMPSWSGTASEIQYDKLTHINYSFALPNADGTLQALENPGKLQDIVSLGHAQGVKVLIAVGGWNIGDGGGNDADFASLASSAATRTAFVNNLVNMVEQYNLDGVDMDWEYPREGNEPQNYELLMQELGVAMHTRGKLLTAAVVALGWNADGILSGVFDDVDFLNIMAYDGPGHSPYSYAVDALNYWNGRGLSADKIVLGVPFYGKPSWQPYRTLVANGADPMSDSHNGDTYNGINTIKQKTQLAQQQASGIMIWELSQDTNDNISISLLNAIHEEVGTPCNNPSAPSIQITNPSQGSQISTGTGITLTASATDSDGSITSVVFNVNGQDYAASGNGSVYTANWTPPSDGSYTIIATATDNDNQTATSQVIVQATSSGGGDCDGIPVWDAQSVYLGGDVVQHNGVRYEANWWTQNQDPSTNSGEWQVWTNLGDCGGSTNQNPTVSITSPVNNDTFDTGSVISITANAADSDGTITSVEFFVDGSSIGQDVSSPYSINWAATVGNHSLTATATDNEGATAGSGVVNITVNDVVGNQPPNVAISAPTDGASFGEGETVSITANASDDVAITKVEFFVNGSFIDEDLTSPYQTSWVATTGNHTLTARATDNENVTASSTGVSISVSGVGGSCDAPNYVENGGYVAGSQVQNDGNLYECKPHPFTGWCNGAAWAYEPGAGAHWQDAWIEVGPCDGTPPGGNELPTVSITSPTNGASFNVGDQININANATDADGTVTSVEFFVDGASIFTDTSSPFAALWNGTQGNHVLTARATDNESGQTTSSAVNISVGSVSPPSSDLPDRLLVGYWHNFINAAGGMKLSEVSSDWDVINVSFAIPATPTGADMQFVPDNAIYSSVQEFKNDVIALQSQGKKVLISIGGATGAIHLNNASDAQTYSSNMISIIEEYGFDGLDIDLEGSSLSLAGDTDFRNPIAPKIVNFIAGTQAILNHFGPDFILTAAPETLFVQGGFSGYGGSTGAYLPVIYAFRNELTYIHVQHYNTGCMLGLDGQCYSQGTADFQVAMAEMLLQGFPVPGNPTSFPALRQDQVAIGLPATQSAAGGGYTSPAVVQQALDYLVKGISFGGSYTLVNPAGYSDFRGLMTWSINWDKAAGFEYSSNHRPYLDALGPVSARAESETHVNQTPVEVEHISIYPNPHANELTVSISLDKSSNVSITMLNMEGKIVERLINNETLEKGPHELKWSGGYPAGLYFMKVLINNEQKILKVIRK